eukprot:gene9439-1645_t
MKQEEERLLPTKHFLVLLHGLHGSYTDYSNLVSILKEKKDLDLTIFSPSSVDGTKSAEGISKCGNLLSKEIEEFIDTKIKEPHTFSIMGHSLGGLFARYCIKQLFSKPKIKDLLIPLSYYSIVTPHLGVRRPSNENLFKNIFSYGVHAYCNYSGYSQQELIIEDEKKILFTLCEDEFISILKLFKYKTLISIPNGDYIVPFCSSSIRFSTPFSKIEKNKIEKIEIKQIGFSNFKEDKYVDLLKDLKEIQEEEVGEFKGISINKSEYSDEKKTFSTFKQLFEKLDEIDWRRLYIQPQIYSTTNYFKRGVIVHNLIISNIVDEMSKYEQEYQSVSYKSLYFLSDLIQLDLK